MKSLIRRFSTALLLSTLTCTSCKKDESAATKGGSPGGPAESAGSSAATAAASATKWGFAARLPKSTESFAGFYRLADLVEGFRNSGFLRKVRSNEFLNQALGVEGIMSAFESPEFKQGAALAGEIAGKEAIVAMSAGATENLTHILKSVKPFLTYAFRAGFQKSMKRAAGGAPAPDGSSLDQKSMWATFMEENPAAASAMISGLIDSEIPPVLVALKAGGARDQIDAFVKQALESIPPDAKRPFENGSFTLEGKYAFQTLIFSVANLNVSPEAEAAELREFTKLFGSEEKAKSALAKFKTKTLELSWGWVDDHLVVGVGRDHSHVVLAAPGDSVLSLPEVSRRIGLWDSVKPSSLVFSSQKTVRAMAGALGSLTETLVSLLEAAGASAPVPLDGIIADLKKLGTRADELWPNDSDALIATAWWDGGLHAEGYGGAKPRSYDSSKPLSLGSLAGPATFFVSESRVNEAERDKTFAYLEEVAATLYAGYQKNIKPALPPDAQSKAGMAEGIGIAAVKGLWKSVQDFRAALGNESAFLMSLDGTMPDLPQVPERLKTVKIPRLLVVSELKDRPKLAESWKGVEGVIGLAVSMAKLPISVEPIEKKDGELTMWGFEIPALTGDLWPHTAVAGNLWFAGTSPSFTKEAATKVPAPSGPPSGAHVRVNFEVLWNYLNATMASAPNIGPQELAAVTSVVDLMGALHEFDYRAGEDKGEAHCQCFLWIIDPK